jgi:hypothetical protein
MPKGAMLMADEQTGDETTGETIARGNAELTIAARAVRARADEIAIRPGRNEVTFTGKALVFAGDKRYESEAVVCSLDFLRCTDAMTVPPPVQAEAVPQPAAATTP